MDTYNIYKDIQARTNGEIYIGVVDLSAPENLLLSADSWNWQHCPIWKKIRERK